MELAKQLGVPPERISTIYTDAVRWAAEQLAPNAAKPRSIGNRKSGDEGLSSRAQRGIAILPIESPLPGRPRSLACRLGMTAAPLAR